MSSLLLSHCGMHERAHLGSQAKASTVAIRCPAQCATISLRPPPHTFHMALPYRQASSSSAPRPFINDTLRTRRGLINGRYEPPDNRRARPPRAEPRFRRLHSSLHHIISIHLSIFLHGASPATRLGSRNPSPLIQRRFSRSTFGESPRIHLWCPQATIHLGSCPNARKIRTLRTTSWSRPRRPPRPAHIHHRVLVYALHRAIATLRPKPSPRAGPVPFLRAAGSLAIASFRAPHITHEPHTSLNLTNGDSTPIHAIPCLRNVFTYRRHSAQSPLSPCFRRARRQPPRDTAP
ncbi:hypothetical protein K438DRAFT_1199943 [Mycena galopus ATCC 62051]|nr:hypothetical protein K438DRAFT_1199943 [Mycena galopus ATCC 62051]